MKFFFTSFVLAVLATLSVQAQVLDPGFPQTNGSVKVVRLHGNTLYIGGDFTVVGGLVRNKIAAIDLASKTVTDWNPNVDNTVVDIAVDNGVVYFCGKFTGVKGSLRNAFAAVDSVTGNVISFNPTIVFPGIPGMQTGTVSSLCIQNHTLYLAGYFISINGVSRPNVAAFDLNTQALTAFNPQPDIPVNLIEVSGDLLYLGGPFYKVNGVSRVGYAAVNLADGSLSNWNPQGDNPGNTQYAILPDGNDRYIAGSFFNIAGTPRPYLAKVDQNGLLSSWDPSLAIDGINRPIRALAPSKFGLVVGGNFTQIGGAKRFRLASLDETTGLAKPWDPAPSGVVHTLTSNDSYLVVGGDFQTISGESRSYLAVYWQGQLLSAKPAPQAVEQLQVRPNPAVSSCTVLLPEGNVQTLQLFTSSGALVQPSVELQGETVRLSTDQLPGGLYFLQLLMADGRWYEARVVVEHP